MELGGLRNFNLAFTSPMVADAYTLCSPVSKKFSYKEAIFVLLSNPFACIPMAFAIYLSVHKGCTKPFLILFILSTIGVVMLNATLFIVFSFLFLKTPKQRNMGTCG